MSDGFITKPNNWNNINYNYKYLYHDINVSKVDNLSLDVVFILAGGFNNKGVINEWVKRRLDYFIKLYNSNNSIKYVVCLEEGLIINHLF